VKAMILLAHGSRREASALEVRKLAEELEKMASGKFDFVRPAFVQFCGPTFYDMVDELVGKGVGEIVVLPYFISAGNHVAQDIPELITTLKGRYPELVFRVTDHFGKFKRLKALILDEASKA